MKKRYAFAGAGNRGLNSYIIPLKENYSDIAELVGVYDINWKRSEVAVKKAGLDIPVYRDFEQMIKEAKPDVVIVTTVDAFHHEYVIKSLEMGCDVVCEKPLTTDAEKANAIIKAERETGKKITVIFNLRYEPYFARAKEIMMSGVIGDVVAVHFQWDLDFDHGVSYYRRWNSEMKNSQGLELHKCTHHFDIANWLVGSEPETVFAFADHRYYGDTNGIAKAPFCHECKDHCKFYHELSQSEKDMFLDCCDVDGYTPDKCIYRSGADIPDVLSVNVRYKNRALMSYTLNTHSPIEGNHIIISGTKGRMELERYYSLWNNKINVREIKVYPFSKMFGQVIVEDVPELAGSHGGSDDKIRDDFMRGRTDGDPLHQAAGVRDGIMSIGIGIAANKSIESGLPIKIDDLYPELFK